MTASHNPAEYQGLKFSTYNGAPATPEVTKQIEDNIAQRQAAGWTFKAAVVGTFACKTIDPQPDYFKQLRKVDPYKGKGLHLEGAHIRRKQGKTGKK